MACKPMSQMSEQAALIAQLQRESPTLAMEPADET